MNKTECIHNILLGIKNNTYQLLCLDCGKKFSKTDFNNINHKKIIYLNENNTKEDQIYILSEYKLLKLRGFSKEEIISIIKDKYIIKGKQKIKK